MASDEQTEAKIPLLLVNSMVHSIFGEAVQPNEKRVEEKGASRGNAASLVFAEAAHWGGRSIPYPDVP